MTARPISLGWTVALAGAGVLALLAVAPAVLPDGPAALVRLAFAPLCHQIPDRSPHLHGEAFALCHRCWGILVGFVAGIGVAPVAPPGLVRRLDARGLPALALAGVPTALDWLAGATGVWANTPVSRMATGVLFGLVAGLLVGSALQRPAASVSSLHPTLLS